MTTAQRSPLLPDVPPVAELYKGFEIDTWWGLVAPAGTPKTTIERLNAAFVGALNAPEVRAKFAQLMAEPVPTTPQQFGEFMRQLRDRTSYAFALVSVEGEQATFQNEAHDYPKRIVYWRTQDGALHYRTQGTDGDPVQEARMTPAD